MKTQNNYNLINKFLPGLAILWLVLSQSSPAHAVDLRKLKDACTVTTSIDSRHFDRNGDITLKGALHYANQKDIKDQACRNSITITSRLVNLRHALVIAIKNIPSGGYLIEGKANNQENAVVTLNADGIDASSGCVVTFQGGTSDITLKNIVVRNVPAGMSGICLKDVNSIKFVNVHIHQVRNGYGIVFESSATNNIIFPGASFKQITGGSAIQNLSTSGGQGFNQLHGTNRVATAGIGSDGLAIFAPLEGGGVEQNTSLFSIQANQFVTSTSPLRIRIDRIAEQGQEVFRVYGTIVEGGTEEDICSATPKAGSAGVERIQIYSVKPRSATAEESAEGIAEVSETAEEGKFLSYVVKKATSGPGASSGNGIDVQGSTQGKFSFTIDRKTGVNMLVLVPELNTHEIGGASTIIQIERYDGDCGEKVGELLPGGGISLVAGNRRILASYEECKRERGIGADGFPTKGLDPEFDSDGDGLPDFVEDLNGDCVCSQDDISCWNSPDSDYDGIPDPLELPLDKINLSRAATDSLRYIPGTLFCEEGSVTGAAPTSDIVEDVCDVDRDGKSNAQDEESDGDLVPDYVEDRKRAFVPRAKAYYYFYEATGGSRPTPYKDKDGIHVECSDEIADYLDKGVFYGVYQVKTDQSQRVGKPTEVPLNSSSNRLFAEQLVTNGETLIALACRNVSVSEPTNFDGRKNGDAETHAYDFYSPDDPACRGGTKKAGGDCVLKCENRETLNAIAVDSNEETEYFEMAGGQRKGLKKVADPLKPGEMIEKLFTLPANKIKEMCSDIDKDGIPDCVEYPEGECTRLDEQRGLIFNPYLKDTDDDGVLDGASTEGVKSDTCPLNNPDTCPVRDVYQHRRVLAYFLDRDGDTINDGYEDLNRNGEYDNVEGGLSGRETTETNLFSTDSDNDGIDDKIEIRLWGRYTNPADKDTDGDGLPDSLEVKDYAESPRGKKYDGSNGQGCQTFAPLGDTHDLLETAKTSANRFGTDPANEDTDGDGVKDGVEVKGTLSGKIPVAELLAGLQTGFNLVSDPLNHDSDQDGVLDGEEYGADGVLTTHLESNPCDSNTDGNGSADSRQDLAEPIGCRSNPDERCIGGTVGGLLDSDQDGIPDSIEVQLGTNPKNPDSDLDGPDGLLDGEEMQDHVNWTRSPNDTDPLRKDTDGDGLLDGDEVKILHTNPNHGDTDGDLIPDGVEVKFQVFNKADTDPTNPDTDGDGLCDGNKTVQNGGPAGDVSCVRGEDIDLDGNVKTAPGNPNLFLETDPRNADSDSDGAGDREEICNGGSCNIAANLGRATQGRSEGCFSVNGRSDAGPTSFFYLFGLLLIGNRVYRRKLIKVAK